MDISLYPFETTFGVKIEDSFGNMICEDITNPITHKINNKLIEQIRDLLTECCRFNEQPDIVTAKWFVESLLTEKEIRELIKQLEN